MSERETTFDPLVEERVAEGVTLPRHPENGNPFIVPRGETDAIEYTRASALSGYLVRNIHHLKQWEERYLAQAIARNPDLAARAAAVFYSTGPLTGTQPISARKAAAAELDAVIADGLERERIHEAANAGTAVHAATEPGAPASQTHPLMEAAVEAYHDLCAGLDRVASEVFVANDVVRAGGTFDSAYISPEYPGFIICGDTKTGKNFHQAEFEIQLATYARGEVYLGPPVDGEDQRIPFADYFGLPMNLDVGYLVHVPLEGKPKPRIVKLDLQRGWELAQSAARTRDDQRRMDKIGIGEKVDHRGLAALALQTKLNELFAQWDAGTLDGDAELRSRGRELRSRFIHVWTETDTELMKARL